MRVTKWLSGALALALTLSVSAPAAAAYGPAPAAVEAEAETVMPDGFHIRFVDGERVVAEENVDFWSFYSAINIPRYIVNGELALWTADEIDLTVAHDDYLSGQTLDLDYTWTSAYPTVTFRPVVEGQLADDARIVDLGWAQFLTVDFAEGYDLSNTTLTVDGVDITDAVTPVTTDGSLVKWEITSPDHASLVLRSGYTAENVALGGSGAAPAVLTEGQTPDYFLLNGPIYVWDFHLTNYDDEGNIRYAPAQTTIGLDAVTGATAYSPDAIVYEDETALPYFVKGTVELHFNYETEAEKAYVDGITDVDLVSANEYKNTLNDALRYEIETGVAHGDRTNAVITVAIGQENFTSNGRYNLRVTSGGKAQLFPIHVVNEVVPSMSVTGDTGYSGKEVHLRIQDMTYGITRPIYRVDLTDVYGKTETLAMYDDWFLFGDLLVLYNDKVNHFPKTGAYTVTVSANGFQTFSHTFWQTAIEGDAPAAVPVDAITTASVGGGGSSGGDGGSGDSKFMNANLIVDADLLANAKLAVAMGLTDEAAQGISDRWDSMSKLYVFDQGAETVYDAEAYFDAVNTACTEGTYLTFADYISGDAVTTPNRPYAVKQVLEDNLLGETTGFIEAVGKTVPAASVEVVEDEAVITMDDETYLNTVADQGKLFLDGNSLPLSARDFTIEGNTITLHSVKYGQHLLSVRVDGYQTVRVAFERVYPKQDVQLTARDAVKGEEIVITCNAVHENGVCDFMSHVQRVWITAPNGKTDEVMADGVESVFEEVGFKTTTRNLLLGKDLLNQDFAKNEDGSFAAGTYKVVIRAEYYGDVTVMVEVADAPQQPGTNATPAVTGIRLEGGMLGKYYRTSFEGEGLADYLNAITAITLNGTAAKKVTNLFGETKAFKLSNDPAYGGKNQFVDFTADCFGTGTVTVVISAKGYEDLTFTVVNGQVEIVLEKAPAVKTVEHFNSMMDNYYRVSFDAESVQDYFNAVTKVEINGTEVNKVSSFWGETNAYHFSNDPAFGGEEKFMDFTADCFTGKVTLTVTATGYETLSLDLMDGEIVVPVVDAPAVEALNKAGSFFSPIFTLSFQADEDTAAAYLAAVTSVTLNGTEAKQVTILYGETKAYKFSPDPAFGGKDQFVDFTADCFTGTVEVVITAEGYTDLTFTAVDGALKGAETVEAEKPGFSFGDFFSHLFGRK